MSEPYDDKMEDPPMYRIGRQVHDHDVRIRFLERDFAELTLEFKEIKKALAEMSLALNTIAKDMKDHVCLVEANIRNEFLRHEKTEMAGQGRVLRYLVALMLTAIGSALYLVAQQVLTHTL